ncbi:MAG TPA: Cof-type HAD-IIB family hydrolase, partial [Stellaceae bacterium]|nr:Cof-type HAD-IIB family hydrolase [Stellaceae bacterium]
MAAVMISLLIADVDGTLLTEDKVLTDRARDAVHRLHAAGIAFAITSGRPPRGMAMLVEPLALRTPIAGFNGGIFVTPDMRVVEQHVLGPAASRRALEVLDAHGLDAWVYSGEDWFIRDPHAPHVAREQWTVKFAPVIADDFTTVLDRAVKIVGVSDDRARMEAADADAAAELKGEASVARSQPYYLDITHPDADKGKVVTALARLLSIPEAAIATIGDMPNDILMFRRSGLSIAMGNASAEVQKEARFV